MTYAHNLTLSKFATEADRFYLDCSAVLEPTDTITGTPALSFEPAALTGADALAFSSISVNAAPQDFPDGRSARIGACILVRIAGGTPASASEQREYTVIATFTTNSGNTKTVRGRLLLLPLVLS